MQSRLLLLVLVAGLLVACEGDAMAYFYPNTACSGSPTAGISLILGACQSDNSVWTCNSNGSILSQTIYHSPGCSGTSDTSNIATNNCTLMTKAFCFETLSVSKNSFIQYQYMGGTCSGTPIQKYFGVFDICIPAGGGQNTSVHFTYNQSLNIAQQVQYTSHDCTGPSVPITIPFGSGAAYYSTQPFSVSNLVGYYQYADTKECSGTPNSGVAYSLNTYGKCHFGKRVTCSNNKLVINTYGNRDCSGNTTNSMDFPLGLCIQGKKPYCSGPFSIPAPYMANIQYTGFRCGENINYIDFSLLDTCISSGTTQSKRGVYNPLNNEVVFYAYASSPNCSAGTPNTPTSVKLDSYTIGLSSSLLSAMVSKFLIIFLILTLNYLF